MTNKETYKRLKCMVWHQEHWKRHTVGIQPYVSIDVCYKCGASHVARRGFATQADIDRNVDKALKAKI